jgi:hypothetical protein
MATTWTLVYQPSQFSPHFQPTGDVYATWDAAIEAYNTSRDERIVQAWATYVVPADATECMNEATGRTLKIAPTAAAKKAAKERAAKIAKIIADDDACMQRSNGWSALRGFSGRLGYVGVEHGDREATAAYAVDHGMTWSDVCQTQA